MPFHVTCKACHFETTVETHEECVDAVLGHRDDRTAEHGVEFTMSDEAPFFEGGVSDMDPAEAREELKP